MKYFQQFDESDCGAACLAMIASNYGKWLHVSDIRNDAGTDTIGTNIKGMIVAAQKYGLRAKAFKGTPESLSKKLKTPFIAHLRIDFDEIHWTYHYVVVNKIGKNKIEIWDPNPIAKKQKISKELFLKEWTGYVIFFEPDKDFEKSKKRENLLLKFLPAFFPHVKEMSFAFIASVLLLVLGVVSSFYYKYLFDEVIYSKEQFALHAVSFGVLFVIVIQQIITAIRSALLSHFSFKTDLQLNFSYLEHIFKLPVSFFESRNSGEVLSRLGDLDKIKQTISSAALSGIMDIVMLIISSPILFKIDAKLFGVSCITVILAGFISVFFARIFRSYYSKVMSEDADVQSYLYESMNGASTVKALNAENIVSMEFEKKKMKYVNTNWKLNNYKIKQEFLSSLLRSVSELLIYWIGCTSIIGSKMSFGTLITFNSMLAYFTGPLFRLMTIQNEVQEALVAAERVGEILELEREKDNQEEMLKPEKFSGSIKFEDVTFAYGSRRPIYNNLNLEIPPNSWTAFVGPSGSGKSTFVKLILKFYEVTDGKIYLDGNDIRNIDISYLRSKVGYVPQDIFIFSGTVRDNIALHKPDATLEEIIDVCKKAGAHSFIEKLPNRYDTILGEHGGGLSGGEKQRLALARALLGNPTFIILDEATSSLDTVSEMEIFDVFKKLKEENIAVILIAHRLTTVMNCDNIFVMKEGQIIQQGTHEQLVKQDGLYKEMWTGKAE